MKAPLAAGIAIAVGLIVLAGYFIPNPILQNVRALLLDWGILLAAVASLVAVINLVTHHIRKAASPGGSRLFSILVLISFFVTFLAGMILGTANVQFQHIVTNIQVPIETSLLAVLSISLAYAAFLFIRQRSGWGNTVFMVSAVIFLLINSWYLVLGQGSPFLEEIVSIIQKIPLAGSRGILIGIALGSLVTGLRILTGIDRPYSG
jgi:hypothetical protein